MTGWTHSPLSRLAPVPVLIAFAVLAAGCVMVVEPETAENPAGTTHTVTVHWEVDTSQLPPGFLGTEAEEPSNLVTFEVVDGPNKGVKSNGNDCDPTCAPSDPFSVISWTYQSNGEPGTDSIEVCSLGDAPDLNEALANASAQIEATGITVSEFLAQVNADRDTNFVTLQELMCQTVTKTWIAPTPTATPETQRDRQQVREVPNIGGALSGLLPSGQPTALPTAPQAVAPAANTVIRPPNTGDAGLR